MSRVVVERNNDSTGALVTLPMVAEWIVDGEGHSVHLHDNEYGINNNA